MNISVLLTSLILLISCGKHEGSSSDISVDLKAKASLYTEETIKLEKELNYVDSRCDDLLFRCLSIFSGSNLSYTDHFDSNGQLFRSKDHMCYDDYLEDNSKGSASDISKDMLLGFLFCGLAKKDSESIQKVIDYANGHSLIMGRGDPTRTIMSLTLYNRYLNVRDYINEAYRIKDKANTNDENEADGILIKEGFEAHLQVLNIYIDSILNGHISDISLKILEAHKNRSPRNALFHALYHKFSDGIQGEALRIIEDNALYPTDRLPTSSDRCASYLWEKEDQEKDWGPCPTENRRHSGVDFLFINKIIEE